MKELSIEEKAKAYDEAIERAKDMLSYKEVRREDIEYLFPALKESEDERIRKELICYFEKYPSIVIGPFNTKECIAWLEKQSTPQVRTGLEWVNTIDDACDKRYLEEYAHGEYCNEQSFKWGFQEGVDWLEKQSKQKPVELKKEEKSRLMKKCVHRAYQQGYDTGFHMATTELEHKQEWSEEDEEIHRKCICAMRASACGFPEEEKFVEQVDNWLKSLKDRVQPQKQEWSDVDKDILFRTIDNLKFLRDTVSKDPYYTVNIIDVEREINLLESIKDRVQPKQEWSEKDEKVIDDAESWLDMLCSYLKNNSSQYIPVVKEVISKLKSLRPQNKWKPSDEQMDALHYVTNFDYGGHKSTLVSLYEQLKKLK